MATSKGKGTRNRAPARSSGRGGASRGRKPPQSKFPISTPTIGLILVGVGIVLLFCLITPTNATAIVAVRGFVNGNFGKLGAVMCLLIVVGGLQLGFGDRWPFQRVLWVQAALLMLCLATVMQVFRLDDMLRALRMEGYEQNYNGFLWKSYDASRNVALGGGALGAVLAYPMGLYLDTVGSVLILVLVMIGIVLWLLRTLMPDFGDHALDWLSHLREDMAERRREREETRRLEAEEAARLERERGKNGEELLPETMFGEEDEDGVPRVKPAPKKKKAPPKTVIRPAGRPEAEEDDGWIEPDEGLDEAWRDEFEWQPEERKSEWQQASRKKAAAQRPAKRPQRPPEPEPEPEPAYYSDEDEPLWEETEWPQEIEYRQTRLPAKRTLYIENEPTSALRGEAYTDYDAERYKYATRPSRRDDPNAMPDFIVKRRTQMDEQYGRAETHPPATEEPPREGEAGRAYYERMQTAKEGLSEWQPPARFTSEPMAIADEPEVEEMPPEPPQERIQPKRALSVSRALGAIDREPQLDPQTRLDRPDWKPPEPEAPVQEEDEGPVYRKPPFSLLIRDEKREAVDTREADARNSKKLEETLQSFGVSAKVTKVVHGPAITRFELQPAPGVKVSKIVGLTDDIALNMAAVGVRIEAPIPGKAAIGIEIANKETQTVHLREVLESEDSLRNASRLAVALGKDIAGKSIIADLAKMPHLLIAGQTGAGKSVCINTIITSIMYRATPDEVRMILIDPKKVELAAYNGVPHLLVPVVTDPKKASGALNWAVMEMDERYRLFAEIGVRDIKGYNQRRDPDTPLMPQIVVIIDELSDLMLVAPGEVEEAICRIAQLARACGIHLVVATQRPSVNVITGIIKANIPSRIAFEVSSQVDSRTILDSAGAEKLLGKGDMLFAPSGGGKPTRVQGCFVSDDEVQRVVEYVKDRSETAYNQAVIDALDTIEEAQTQAAEAPGEDTYDALFEQAAEMAIESGQASISMLQRRLRIGYARAGRLVDEMARRGIIGQAEGAKPREVLVTREEFYAMFKK